MYGSDEEERPRPPEPEIIYTPEEEDSGGRTRLIAGAFIGIALLGGVLVALSLNDGGSGVAPVAPDITAAPEQTAPTKSTGNTAAVSPETAGSEAATAGSTVPGATVPDAAADLRASTTPESPDPAPAAEAAVPAAPERAAKTEAPASNGAPASLAPAIESRAVEPAPAKSPETAAAPAKPATVAAAPASGGAWLVQIMALRDEAGAKSAWAALQKKHPSLLGGHALDVEKADLGDKGVFYRVRAAGFETKSAAQSTCASLKAAGQDCLVKSR
ncbi:MAG: SPOR domain-containing protein [Parvibaculum sp.]